MIAYLRGKLTFIYEESIVLDVGGIGYEVICPNPFIYQGTLEQELFIHTYHHVREDIICLYGFEDEEQKYLFTKLISVSGIGPKSAVAILGAVHAPDFVAAVETEDEKYLTQFPGVGKKTARQIILDLKGKLTGLFTIEAGADETTVTPDYAYLEEAKAALQALGYSQKEITNIMPALQNEDLETDALIKKALSLLVKS